MFFSSALMNRFHQQRGIKLCRREEMNLFIIEKKGRKPRQEDSAQVHPYCARQRQKAHRPVPAGGDGVAWKARCYSDCHLSLSSVSVRRSAVYTGSAKSQQDQNLPWTAQRLCKTNCSWQTSFFLNRAPSLKSSQHSRFHSPQSATWHVQPPATFID